MQSSETTPAKVRRSSLTLLRKTKRKWKSSCGRLRVFVSYSLVRTSKGGFSVTVCQDKAGTDESVRVARDWIAKNAGKTGAAAPKVSEGTVMLNLK